MAHHFNKLTPAEAERLALLAEEAGEVIQAIGKVLRHGYASDNKGKLSRPNRRALECEIGDVLAAIEMLIAAGDVDPRAIHNGKASKAERIAQWMHHQPAVQIPAIVGLEG